jgi:hypothetical protein
MGPTLMLSAADSRRAGVELQAQPFGWVHFIAHEMHEFPQAHSGQIMQHPVEPSLQPASSSDRAAGARHTKKPHMMPTRARTR